MRTTIPYCQCVFRSRWHTWLSTGTNLNQQQPRIDTVGLMVVNVQLWWQDLHLWIQWYFAKGQIIRYPGGEREAMIFFLGDRNFFSDSQAGNIYFFLPSLSRILFFFVSRLSQDIYLIGWKLTVLKIKVQLVVEILRLSYVGDRIFF